MPASRTATAVVGLVASLAISVAAWHYFDTLLLFLVIPFVPLLFRRRTRADRPELSRCPECDFETREPTFSHCPRDGTPLE